MLGDLWRSDIQSLRVRVCLAISPNFANLHSVSFSTLMPPPPQRVIDGTCAWKYPFCPVSVCVCGAIFRGHFPFQPDEERKFSMATPGCFLRVPEREEGVKNTHTPPLHSSPICPVRQGHDRGLYEGMKDQQKIR